MEMILVFFVLVLVALPLIIIILSFNTRFSELTRRIQALELRIQAREEIPATPASSASVAGSASIPAGTQPAARPGPLPAAPPAPSVSPLPPAKPAPASRGRQEWEVFVGGKLLNRIGALALIIGTAFFLKYAFDNNWISPLLRVATGGLIGIILLFLGDRFHKKAYVIFSQGLIGSGIAICYLSVFAAFNYYELVSQMSAFILMSVVTIAAFLLAFRYNSLAVSILAWAGGFLTPFLLSTGTNNETGLFAYIDILEAGLLAVVIIRQSWAVLELLTLAGTYTVFSLWYGAWYSDGNLLLTALFLTLFWGLFYITDLFRILNGDSAPLLHRVAGLLNAVVYYAWLYALVDKDHHGVMGLLTFLLAVLYAIPAYLSFRRERTSPALREYLLTTLVLVIIGTAVQFSGFVTVTLWGFEALALMYFARRWNSSETANAALLFFVVIFIKILMTRGAFSWAAGEEFTPIWNLRFMALGGVSCALGISARLLGPTTFIQKEFFQKLLDGFWCFLAFILVTVETSDIVSYLMQGDIHQRVEFTRLMAILRIWTIAAVLYAAYGVRIRPGTVMAGGTVLLALTAACSLFWSFSYSPLSLFVPVLNTRFIALAVILAGSFLFGRLVRNGPEVFRSEQLLGRSLLIGQILMILFLVTVETRDYFEKLLLEQRQNFSGTQGDFENIENFKQLLLSSFWLIYGIILMIGGIWRREKPVRLMAMGILGIAILKIFVYDLSFLQTPFRIISFIGLGLILLAASFLYQRYKIQISGNSKTAAIPPGEPGADENAIQDQGK
jgi:uncharacterized membrane protein